MGHTSLLYLQSEYFDVVKLDGSLTRPLLKSHTNQKIVRSIIELGQELGVNVIAEFVENRSREIYWIRWAVIAIRDTCMQNHWNWRSLLLI